MVAHKVELQLRGVEGGGGGGTCLSGGGGGSKGGGEEEGSPPAGTYQLHKEQKNY